MKSSSLAVIALIASVAAPSFSAHAEDKPASLTVSQCLTVLRGLRSLSGYERVIKENGVERAIANQQYKLGDARLTISLNIGELNRTEDAVSRSRTALMAELMAGGELKDGTPQWLAFLSRLQAEILDRPCNVTLGRIKIADLKLGDGADQNAVPPTAIADILAILDR